MIPNEETIISVKRDEFHFSVMDGPICHTEDGWDFWKGDFPSVFEPFTMNWIRTLGDRTKDFLDIGAWVGPTTLFGSMFYRGVYSFEPDPVAFKYLSLNKELNRLDNIELFPEAVSVNAAPIPIYARGEHGNSMSNSLHESAFFHVANARGLSSILNWSKTNFALIKIDIEGAESLIIPAAEEVLVEKKIPLIISFHLPMYREADAFDKIVSTLTKAYSAFFNEEGERLPSLSLSHPYGTILCL